MACFQGFGFVGRLIWERVVNGTLGVFGSGVGFWRTMGIVGEPAGAGFPLWESKGWASGVLARFSSATFSSATLSVDNRGSRA